MEKYCMVVSTFSKKKEAEKILTSLLKKKLVACGNLISGVESLYWWEGKIEKSDEVMVWLKTERDKVKKVMAFIEKNHPYQVPEVLVLPILKGNEAYLKWVSESLK